MTTYHFELRQGEAKRLRFQVHADPDAQSTQTGPLSLEGVEISFRIAFDDDERAHAGAVEAGPGGPGDDVATVDFGAIDTSAWPIGRWRYQVWLRWAEGGGWEPRLGGDFKVLEGIT